jgi:hypothetical protein
VAVNPVEQLLDDIVVTSHAIWAPPPGWVRTRREPGVRQVFLDHPDLPNERPIIEVRVEGARIHVRRNVAMRGGGWLEEYVGSVPFERGWLKRCLERALVGTSRLPITSTETPLPVYTLGMIAYRWPFEVDCDESPAMGDASFRLDQQGRALEITLRTQPPEVLLECWRPNGGLRLGPTLRSMFNLLALSPYAGDFVENLVLMLRHINRGVAVDSIGYMLRHLARHLNAFDLVRFHNRGANYPDALFLDELLRVLMELLDEQHDTPVTRAALLHGWLARKRCENLLVPAAPTSPGEAARFMPPPYEAVDPERRDKRLFADALAEAMLTPAASDALRRAAAEADPREFGMATFLDRPLGTMKCSGEADRTAMLSYEAFSRRLAQRRMNEMIGLGLPSPRRELPEIAGYPVAKMLGHAREGVVALEDAKKAALDFVFTRTTRSSLGRMIGQYDWSALDAAAPELYRWLGTARDVLLIRTGRGEMTAFDDGRPMLKLTFADARYVECAGEEFVDSLAAVVENHPPLTLPPRCT